MKIISKGNIEWMGKVMSFISMFAIALIITVIRAAVQAGVNLVYIRDFLGHFSVSTTEIYARTDSKFKREALEKAYVGVSKSDHSEEAMWLKDTELCKFLHNSVNT